MCVEAAKGVKLQCGREYGFDNSTTDVWATILSDLDKAELKGLPTHNITAERKLAVFDKPADKVGKCRNYKFTPKSVRNDMQLYSGKQGTVNKIVRNITKLLDVRGWKWDEKEKGKLKQRLQEKVNKALRAKDYAKKLLKDCKAWGGLCASCEDLLAVLSS